MPLILSGSLDISGSIAAQVITIPGGGGIVSSSTQIQNYDVFALNSNLYNSTGSIKGEIAGIEAYTSSLKGAIEVSGQNVNVLGMITAQQFNVTYVSSSVMYQSGSTKFGDTSDDKHEFTGSVSLKDSLSGTSATFSGAVSVNGLATSGNYKLGVTGSAYVNGSNSKGVFITDQAGYASIVGLNSAISTYNPLELRASSTDYQLYVHTNGNVGVGASSPAKVLDVYSSANINTAQFVVSDGGSTNRLYLGTFSNAGYISFGGTYQSGWSANGTNAIANIGFGASSGASTIQFETSTSNGVGPTERMRITAGGYLKASNDGTYYDSTGAYHELRNTGTDYNTFITSTNASPNGVYIAFTGASPNGTGNPFIICRDSGPTTRAEIRSNGGLANYSANDVNLSDIRTKKDIAPLDSYWNKFKVLEIVKFKYNDQTHDDYNIGVIAQQVEEVAPEFVDIDGWGETPEDGVPLKSVYTSDLHHATIKVLQEAMSKIEEQQAQIEELKAQNDSLKEILQRNNIA